MIVVAPDTPLIGFLSPGPSTQTLTDDSLESIPFPVPELGFVDSQTDATPLSKLVNNVTEEHVTQTPPQSKTSEPTPEAEQAERRRKKSNETKSVLY